MLLLLLPTVLGGWRGAGGRGARRSAGVCCHQRVQPSRLGCHIPPPSCWGWTQVSLEKTWDGVCMVSTRAGYSPASCKPLPFQGQTEIPALYSGQRPWGI